MRTPSVRKREMWVETSVYWCKWNDLARNGPISRRSIYTKFIMAGVGTRYTILHYYITLQYSAARPNDGSLTCIDPMLTVCPRWSNSQTTLCVSPKVIDDWRHNVIPRESHRLGALPCHGRLPCRSGDYLGGAIMFISSEVQHNDIWKSSNGKSFL